MLEYDPSKRITAIEALCHPFFDSIRDPNTTLPDGQPLPPVLNFSSQGILMICIQPIIAGINRYISLFFFCLITILELSIRPDLIHQLVPAHYEHVLLEQGIDINHFEPIPLDQIKVDPSLI